MFRNYFKQYLSAFCPESTKDACLIDWGKLFTIRLSRGYFYKDAKWNPLISFMLIMLPIEGFLINNLNQTKHWNIQHNIVIAKQSVYIYFHKPCKIPNTFILYLQIILKQKSKLKIQVSFSLNSYPCVTVQWIIRTLFIFLWNILEYMEIFMTKQKFLIFNLAIHFIFCFIII